jgi:hypothetical protein
MTKEQRAQQSRENGAKSKGPKTDAGKAKVARNAITHGDRADKLKNFVPPHSAVLCNEERQQFYQLMEELTNVYQPINSVALGIVRDIAVARWQILRLDSCITSQWNLALVDNAQKPLTVAPELGEVQTMARSAEALYTGHAIVHRFNRQIDQLEIRIARLERRLRHLQAYFPGNEQTCPLSPQPVENTGTTPENKQYNEQPIYVTENTPAVLAYYRQHFPNRKLVILPADDVAKGIERDDPMPDIPRRAA